MEVVSSSARKNKRLVNATITVLITVVLFFVSVQMILHRFGVECENKYSVDRCYIVTNYTDGITRFSVNNRFEPINTGDEAWISFTVPQGIYTIFPNPVLRFNYYNCAIKIFDEKDNLIYSDGWVDVGKSVPEKFIGNATCVLPLFTKAYNLSGQCIKIYMYSLADRSNSDFNAYIVRSVDSWKVPIDGHQGLFVMLMAVVVISALLALYGIVKSLFNMTIDIGVSVFLMVFSFSMWSMGSQNMVGVLIQNLDMCAKVEYYALYTLSIAIALFGFTFFKSGIFHIIWGWVLLGVSVFFLTVCAIHVFSDTLSVQSFMVFLLVIIIAEVIFLAIGTNIDKKIRGEISTVIIRCGVLIMLLMASLEIGRYFLMFLPDAEAVAKSQLGAYAALVLTGIMMTYYIILTLEAQTSIVERQQLEEIAYKDTLTGIPNRSYFNREMDVMSNNEQKEYTMFFMDLNNLKKANDEYGHDMGDKLIKSAAACMTKAFAEKGVYCRWGGDEFIAFVPGSADNGDECLRVLKDSIESLNQSGDFPFSVSAAIGEVRSDPSDPIDPNSAIREADVRMYETKKKMKASINAV